ncbi:MAG: hypothetical protein NWF09_08475 [Candidatus Bathyarchaeota archaeon]|nr:hypothetical protein [Candidatus Bathyarchaeota archaeon]
MFTQNKKQKMLLIATTALALVFIISFPYAYASVPSATAEETQSSQARMLNAKGIAVDKANGQAVITSAGFALALEATEVNETIIKFNVVEGTVGINGTEFAITEGNGAVLRDKHVFLLQAEGTGPEGQPVTLKLAGRYFWMWGHLYVARIAGSLQTDSSITLLILRAAIRV